MQPIFGGDIAAYIYGGRPVPGAVVAVAENHRYFSLGQSFGDPIWAICGSPSKCRGSQMINTPV